MIAYFLLIFVINMLIILVVISLIAKSDGQTADSCFYTCKYDHIQKGLHFSRGILSLLPSARQATISMCLGIQLSPQ